MMKAILKSKLMFFDALKLLRWSRVRPACKRPNPSANSKKLLTPRGSSIASPTSDPRLIRQTNDTNLSNTFLIPVRFHPLCLDAAYVSTRQTRLVPSTEAAPTDIIWPYVKIYHISRALSYEEASNCISTKGLPSLGFSYLRTCMLIGRG